MPGNHEYYGSDIEVARRELARQCVEHGITLLDRRAVTIDDVRFIGATLWTDFRLEASVLGEARAHHEASQTVPDFTGAIRDRKAPDGLFTTQDSARRHGEDRGFIEDQLANSHPYSRKGAMESVECNNGGVRGSEEIYLDANATVRPLECVVEAVTAAMREAWGNPSSAHGAGVGARRVLARARDATAALLPGIEPEHVVLTSGGTEASNTMLGGAGSDSTLIVCAVEHPATMRPAERARNRGANLVVVPVDALGQADPDAFAKAIARSSTRSVYVSVQWANGETGVIQPVAEISDAIHTVRPDAIIHVDAAQAVGRVRTPALRGIAGLSFSGHKLHGPQGTGVLALGTAADSNIPALIAGGGQERGWRSGTENVAGAAGLGTALEARAASFEAAVERMRTLRDAFEAKILEALPHAMVNGGNNDVPRIPNTTNIRFPGTDGMSLVAQLDAAGMRCSQGSACSSGRPEASHVLRAMGIDEESAYASVRFSFSILNTEEEVDRVANTIADLIKDKT